MFQSIYLSLDIISGSQGRNRLLFDTVDIPLLKILTAWHQALLRRNEFSSPSPKYGPILLCIGE